MKQYKVITDKNGVRYELMLPNGLIVQAEYESSNPKRGNGGNRIVVFDPDMNNITDVVLEHYYQLYESDQPGTPSETINKMIRMCMEYSLEYWKGMAHRGAMGLA
ncbi:MAG: hypothetical protein NZ534_12810 [Bacteroidia bacterium]|nr:hypothetical protein [Bacteroidia bacterium]